MALVSSNPQGLVEVMASACVPRNIPYSGLIIRPGAVTVSHTGGLLSWSWAQKGLFLSLGHVTVGHVICWSADQTEGWLYSSQALVLHAFCLQDLIFLQNCMSTSILFLFSGSQIWLFFVSTSLQENCKNQLSSAGPGQGCLQNQCFKRFWVHHFLF